MPVRYKNLRVQVSFSGSSVCNTMVLEVLTRQLDIVRVVYFRSPPRKPNLSNFPPYSGGVIGFFKGLLAIRSNKVT